MAATAVLLVVLYLAGASSSPWPHETDEYQLRGSSPMGVPLARDQPGDGRWRGRRRGMGAAARTVQKPRDMVQA